MKKHWLVITILLVAVFPQLLLSFIQIRSTELDDNIEESVVQSEEKCILTVLNGGDLIEMALDDYILGVVLGEMPANFEIEALKAQSVASRTYTLRSLSYTGKHENADVCTEASCCQAFVSTLEYSGGEENLQKVKDAVLQTRNQVITYQGNLIEATYFSSSGGMTEDAVEVWGSDVPYLRSVNSPGEESAQNYQKEISFSVDDFLALLGLPETFDLEEENLHFSYTDSGSVDTMYLSDYAFSGVEVRSMLSLPSTVFSVALDGDVVRISTKGYGHRVGMSQYGAEAMALSGNTYRQILEHYYFGAQVEEFSQEDLNAIFDKEKKL